MKLSHPSLPLRTQITLVIIFLASATGLVHTGHNLYKISQKRREAPFVFAGAPFETIRPLFQGERSVGYLTDRDINDKNVGAQFAQAQLALAPIIMDFNNPAHRFLIVDCQDPRQAAAIITRLKAYPVKRSNTGIIIAERRQP